SRGSWRVPGGAPVAFAALLEPDLHRIRIIELSGGLQIRQGLRGKQQGPFKQVGVFQGALELETDPIGSVVPWLLLNEARVGREVVERSSRPLPGDDES